MFANLFSHLKPPFNSTRSLTALLLFPTLVLCGCAHQAIRPAPVKLEAGIVLVPAAPKSGFNLPYLLKMPPQLSNSSPVYLLVEPNNSGHVSENLDDHVAAAVSLAKSGVGFDVARRL